MNLQCTLFVTWVLDLICVIGAKYFNLSKTQQILRTSSFWCQSAFGTHSINLVVFTFCHHTTGWQNNAGKAPGKTPVYTSFKNCFPTCSMCYINLVVNFHFTKNTPHFKLENFEKTYFSNNLLYLSQSSKITWHIFVQNYHHCPIFKWILLDKRLVWN